MYVALCSHAHYFIIMLQNRMNKCSMNEKDRATVLFQDFMSSEESDTESGSLITRPIAWRSHKLDIFFKNLDAGTEKSRSEQSKRQAKFRTLAGEHSQRTLTAPQTSRRHVGRLLWTTLNSKGSNRTHLNSYLNSSLTWTLKNSPDLIHYANHYNHYNVFLHSIPFLHWMKFHISIAIGFLVVNSSKKFDM